MSILFLNILTLLACTQSVDKLLHTLMVLCENEYFLTVEIWTEGTSDFHVQETVEVALPSLAGNVVTREESTICPQRCDLFLAS